MAVRLVAPKLHVSLRPSVAERGAVSDAVHDIPVRDAMSANASARSCRAAFSPPAAYARTSSCVPYGVRSRAWSSRAYSMTVASRYLVVPFISSLMLTVLSWMA